LKKIIIIGSIFFLIAFVIYVIIDIKYGWHIEIASKIEIKIPLSAKLQKKDTHRWISWRWRVSFENVLYTRTIRKGKN